MGVGPMRKYDNVRFDMPDVFISYSERDKAFAEAIYRLLTQEGLNVFLAGISLIPGHPWTPQILNSLKSAPWVIFLASRSACQSPYVQQELGAALISSKKIVSIVWDIAPTELPGWINQYQAINITKAPIEKIREEIVNISSQIKADKRNGLLIAAALAFAAIVLSK